MRVVCLAVLLMLSGWQLLQAPTVQAAPFAYGQSNSGERAESSSDAARIAQQRFGGQVVKVQTQGEGKKRKYKVRLIFDDGRVKDVTVQGQ